MRLQPGINREPWTILRQIWREELLRFRLDRLAISDVDKVDASALPSLARAYDLPPSDFEGLTELQTRAVIKTALLRKKRAGTVWALRQAITDLGFDEVTLTEWDKQVPRGDPFTFAIDFKLLQRGPNAEDFSRVIAAILKAKNKRSYFSTVRIVVKNQSVAPRLAAAARSGARTRIFPFITTQIERRPPLRLATVQRVAVCTRILPQGAV